MTNKHIGSSFDDFLEEEGILAKTHAVALSRTPMNVSFLADQPQFIPIIAQWYFEEWGHLMPPGKTVKDIERKVTTMAQSRQALPLTFVLHDQDTLLAVAELKYHEHSGYPEYEHWLGGVYVPIEKRGRGYSTVILQHALAHAKGEGIPALYLQCEQHNIALYLKHGFDVLHRVKDKGVDKAIMMRTF